MNAQTPIAPKLCINCRWHVHSDMGAGDFDECNAPQNVAPADLVRGEPKKIWTYCDAARAHNCGPDASWFKAV